MARIRSIKPEFWASEQVMELSMQARLAFIGLWNFADDGGVHPASAKTLKAEVFPADAITPEEMGGLVDEMIQQGLVVEFEANGRRYWHVTGWAHQKIDRPTYRHPRPQHSASNPSAIDEDAASPLGGPAVHSANARRGIAEDATSPHPRKGREGKGEEEKALVADATSGQDSHPDAGNSETASTVAPTARALGVRELVAEGVAKQHAEDWLKVRRGKRLPLTATALDVVKAEAATAGMTLAQAIKRAAGEGWAGFKADWVLGESRSAPPPADTSGRRELEL